MRGRRAASLSLRTMTLEQLRVFVKVVQAGSFTRAADLLQTQKSYASRVVSTLEAELGVKLLERTTRTLSVTEAGREIFERCSGILAALDDTVQAAQNMQGAPIGRLRLTCGTEFGRLCVAGWIGEYLQRHPQVTVEAEYTSRLLDLVHEGFDLAIRVGPLEESRLVARKLGDLHYGLFAHPGYLQRQAAPASPDALSAHSLVVFSGGIFRRGWPLARGAERTLVRVEPTPRLVVNDSYAVREVLLAGVGIGLLPLMLAQDDVQAGELQPVLPDWLPPSVPVHAVYPSNRYLSPKVRAFVDLALARFPGPRPAA
jgi:LysR family transcriptional regulator, regulator for bpeEF and oprC